MIESCIEHIRALLPSDSEGWLVLWTSVLTLGTLWLAKRTSDLVSSAEKSSERQLRAYVLIDTAKIENVKVGGHPTVRIQFKNFGQTPAKNFRHRARLGFSTFPKSSQPPEEEWSEFASIHTIGPGGEAKSSLVFSMELTQGHLDRMQASTHAIYVVGEIEYEDAFGIVRFTKYKFFNKSSEKLRDLSVCSDGNSYT